MDANKNFFDNVYRELSTKTWIVIVENVLIIIGVYGSQLPLLKMMDINGGIHLSSSSEVSLAGAYMCYTINYERFLSLRKGRRFLVTFVGSLVVSVCGIFVSHFLHV